LGFQLGKVLREQPPSNKPDLERQRRNSAEGFRLSEKSEHPRRKEAKDETEEKCPCEQPGEQTGIEPTIEVREPGDSPSQQPAYQGRPAADRRHRTEQEHADAGKSDDAQEGHYRDQPLVLIPRLGEGDARPSNLYVGSKVVL